ncbi:MAG: radical SAM protein [Candidatus Aenigmarchaeota archaeon]|nr:radical SAM protein [Candidatus Aenigmarchaeota archaeon]
MITPRNEFINKDKFDFSSTRQNRDNKLIALNYGKVSSVNVEKIEKAPMFHFMPESNSLFIGLPGCNVKSPFCSDVELGNKAFHDNPLQVKYQYQTPEQIVETAEKKDCKSITFTYTEPFIFFEFAFKVAKNAHRGSIKTALVTNGFTTEEPIKKLGKYLDAVTIKIFGSLNPQLYQKYMSIKDVDAIFVALKQFQKQKLFIEITNMVIPQIGDNLDECRKLAAWISHELGAETPFHILQYNPSGDLDILPTATATLERFAEESHREGLRYVYIHSTPPHQEENTFCHNCREMVVERKNRSVKKNRLIDGRCPGCGFRLNFVQEK